MATPINKAVWLTAKMVTKFELKTAPYTPPSADLIVIKTHAIAINPIDYLIPQKGNIMYTWLKYPCIMGLDVAGEVVEVGKNVKDFKTGDRVFGLARATDEDVNDPSQGGFQEYVVLEPKLTAHIPNTMSYETASVIPLGTCTAAAGLFQKDHLALQHPTIKAASTGKTVIIWGGSTSVGCNAIQLAVAAGYEVFTTCSPRNFDFVKKLGAAKAFDYNSKTVIPDMIRAFQGKTAAGAYSIGDGGAEACMAILDNVQGNKIIAMASFPVLKNPQNLVFLRTIFHFITWIASFKVKGLLKGIKSTFIIGSTVAKNDVGKALFADFLEMALETGTFVPAPEVMVFGKGLESIQAACEFQEKGVSAKKVVVSL
ncbi:GroES-like protein [Hyaloscypha variabilis F]|jgi:NADPH:quinone reductase-like Zn-dependent oxidoreductase|uniref:GroES-like protein n=1 Tax=Hyaloscypha variabilis (strain UAMH 11265 / GT02V1 / F) TaxID=1149755 RepID=A0A2J6S8W0_HYAVF|nr:GroES-like protein [Hyaloscypha variabilis F]